MTFPYTLDELRFSGRNINDHILNCFERTFQSFEQVIKNVNQQVKTYNDDLHETCTQLLRRRKQKAEDFFFIADALEIPILLSENAPNTKPVQLKRVQRTAPVRPAAIPAETQWTIRDSDYSNINDIIYTYGTTMEKTARTYYGNNEEELRDHLLAALNTHYENTTGETFRKIGKTDLHIEFKNKAAFIGECKLWSGEKIFDSAIRQVINYSTWRDVKVSVVIFNKENKSFPGILEKIDHWVKDKTVSYKQPHPNFWKTKYHRDDMNIDIELSILAFDLFVDKTQFKDKRYE